MVFNTNENEAPHMETAPMTPELKDLFADKPEHIIDLPRRMLSADKIARYKKLRNPALVEIAGRDSVAAAIKGAFDHGLTDLIPTYVYTGSEYGPWSSVIEAVERLKAGAGGVRVHDLLVFGSPRFWQAINGRFMSELAARYGAFAPCSGCHLYLHACRIPLARTLGTIPIIGGERELHDGRIKVNQIPEALRVYTSLLAHFDVRLLLPLQKVTDGGVIKDLLGMDWDEGADQLGCVLSGNYALLDGAVGQTAEQVKRYLEEFAAPCATAIITEYISDKIPDHIGIARRILETLRT